jgi:hypothetical protein
VYRTVSGADAETVTAERPWAYFDERTGYLVDFGMGPRGQTLAALECLRGSCVGYDGPSEDALLALWVSRDAGQTWEEWGEVPPDVRIEVVSSNDVALWHGHWEDRGTWWFRSGKEVAPPEGHDVDFIARWTLDDEGAVSPLWRLGSDRTSYVTASGQSLSAPSVGSNAGGWPMPLSDGVLWSRVEEDGASLFVVTDRTGAVRDAYAWRDPQRPLRLIVRLDDHRFLGDLGAGSCVLDSTKVLIDLVTRTAHPLPEVRGPRLLLILAAHSSTE